MQNMNQKIRLNTTKFKTPLKINLFFISCIITGIIGFLYTFYQQNDRFYALILVSTIFLTGVALTAVLFTAIQFVAGAKWSIVFRRVNENFVHILPFAMIGFIVILLNVDTVYHHWTHWKDINPNDHVMEKKSVFFLNKDVFVVSMSIIFAILFAISYFMKFASLKQDKLENSKDNNKKILVKLSSVFIIAFSLLFTIFIYGMIMSLEPHWYTTMFSVYVFSSLAYTALGVILFIILLIKKSNGLPHFSTEHLHDLVKYQYIFICFWAYIAFSQFMLIWYANLPEETMYLETRLKGTGLTITLIFWFLRFVIPFFALMIRSLRRNASYVFYFSFYTIFLGFFEIMWMIYPAIHVKGFIISIAEPLVAIGLLGLIGFIVANMYSLVNPIPKGDKDLAESISFQQHN